ncbi:DUF2314 domain-containing protein [Pseudomonas sp. KCJK9111]|uniref:DUF2314 domain-containing protein n=1 Tax=Pseudomonas sp. KCJK9111 TaxID=3344555 RepID=UPI003905B457
MTEQIIYPADDNSPALQTAIANAQATFKFFWRELSWEARRIIKGLDMAAVKMAFPVHGDDPELPTVENMWLSEVAFDGVSISGVLLNEPEWATGFDASQRVTLPFSALTDWMYVSAGEVYGGFTIDAMRSEMPAAERAEHDAAWGLEFGEPGFVALVPAPKGQSQVLLSRALDTPADAQALKQLEEADHPMAVNMVAQVHDALVQHPAMVTDPDEGGWLLLHRETLAGNYPVVSALLEHGADTSALNPLGQTPFQLAEQAGWPRLVRLLRGEEAPLAAPQAPAQQARFAEPDKAQTHTRPHAQAQPRENSQPRWMIVAGVVIVVVVIWLLAR